MTNKNSRGFTLVELAIALMIIGLLIAGVLKGIELVDNARITQTVRQMESYNTAMTAFISIYNAMPGDLINPGDRIAGCTNSYCILSGDHNGRISVTLTDLTDTYGDTSEQGNFFSHMATAGLLTGVKPNITSGDPSEWGVYWPAAVVNGGFLIQHLAIPAAGSAPAINGNFMILKGQLTPYPPSVTDAAGTAAVSPMQAFRLDTKLDDGKPESGEMFGVGTADCTGTDYAATVDTRDCNILFRSMAR